MWLVNRAAQRDLGVVVVAPDMISAELLAFSGVDAAVQIGSPRPRSPQPADQPVPVAQEQTS